MMFTKTCSKCQATFSLGDARLDEHWDSWTSDHARAYCPNCRQPLDGVQVSSVDLARTLSLRNILYGIAFFGLITLGVATASLGIIGPIVIGATGYWFTRTAKLRDHRIIGWFLIGLSILVFFLFVFDVVYF